MTIHERTIDACIGGITGKICVSKRWICLHGKWASHTGFTSDAGVQDLEVSDEELLNAADACYRKAKEFSFAVGDEHREHGWKRICVDYQKRIQIRLPDWHEGIVAATLERYGMVNTCDINQYWTLAADSRVSLQTASSVFEPILRPGTRFACEQEMSAEIDACAINNGFLARTPLSSGAMQAELF
tara:strand:+ start:1438 stop:1995 length:558 start_codon:yes stop_codon:yes gene_type:complete